MNYPNEKSTYFLEENGHAIMITFRNAGNAYPRGKVLELRHRAWQIKLYYENSKIFITMESIPGVPLLSVSSPFPLFFKYNLIQKNNNFPNVGLLKKQNAYHHEPYSRWYF